MGNEDGGRLSGTLVGHRYRLDQLLGEGGMGVVYAAHLENRPGDRYALKVLHDEMAANPTVVERFLAEGDLCRRLDHPGVLRVFDVGQHNGVPFLVMELLEGRALVDYTENLQRLPLNFAVTVCAGVLEALAYAHARNIVHRDLKPENVFLVSTPDGGYRTKLLDFGIARCIDAAGGAKRRTATGVLLGTPGYMSPEQVKAARSADHRADLWAVGVMFYEMVAGAAAFPSDGDDQNNVWGLLSAVLTKEPTPLSRVDPHLAPFDAFIRRALAKDPTQRFQSADEMRDSMLRIGRGELAFSATVMQSESMGNTVIAQAPGEGVFTREQRAVPIQSHGEMSAIPPVAQTYPMPANATPATGPASAPNPWAATAFGPGAAQFAPNSAAYPPSGDRGPADRSPMSRGYGTAAAPAGRAYGSPSPDYAQATAPAFAPSNPGYPPMSGPNFGPPQISYAASVQAGLQQTMPLGSGTPMVGGGIGATAPQPLSPPPEPPFAQPAPRPSPPAFAPIAPTAPPSEGPTAEYDEPRASPLPWILLAVVLIAALVGGTVWVLH